MSNLVFIGCGNMGAAIINALLDNTVYSPENIVIIEKIVNSHTLNFAEQGIPVYTKLQEFNEPIDMVILAVKPQDAGSILTALSQKQEKVKAVLSIMAGITIGTIEAALPDSQIIRCMPNTPAAIRSGMSVFSGNPLVDDDTFRVAQEILETCGAAFRVENEQMIDAATAISGSGPGYVFYFAEALAEGAVELGFDQDQAALLASQTLLGAAKLLHESVDSAQELRKKVTSPGGTTEAAVTYFEQAALKQNLIKGFREAFNRSLELAKLED